MPTPADPYSWPRAFRREIDLPHKPGVYALFLQDGASLPGVLPLTNGLIYIGLGKSLRRRCHFNGRTEGHSPRRSLASLLRSRLSLNPVLGANGNFKLTRESESRLDEWMHDNLLMSFHPYDAIDELETMLIERFAPPLNLNKCRQSEDHAALRGLRASMLTEARRLAPAP